MHASTWANLPVLMSLALIALPALAGPAPSTERQRELMHLLRHDCGSCHGLTLKGGLGPPLLPDNLDGLPPDGLVQIILDGVPGRPMPPWRGLLPESEAAWLVARLQEGIDDAP